VREAIAASAAAAAAPDGDGYSPLQWAALNGRPETAALLLAAGAPVN
jgi:ankyrin repeat protein